MKRLLPLTILAIAIPAIAFEGFSEPWLQADLAPQTRGVLSKIHVKEGDVVEQETPLSEIAHKSLLLQQQIADSRAKAYGNIKAAKATKARQQTRLNTLRQLSKTGDARADEVQQASAERDVASGNLMAAQEDSQVAKLQAQQMAAQIAEHKIHAPFPGIVTTIHKQPGEAADGPVLTLAQLDPLKVVLHIPSPQVAGLGNTVTVTFTDMGQTTTGTIDSISPITDARSGTVPVTIKIPNPNNTLRAGERVTVTFKE